MTQPIRLSVTSAHHQHYLGNGRHHVLTVWSAVISCGSDVLAYGWGDCRTDAIQDAVQAHRACRGTFPSVYANAG